MATQKFKSLTIRQSQTLKCFRINFKLNLDWSMLNLIFIV